MRHDFLLEIGCEELPPKNLRQLAQSLAAGIDAGLQEAGLERAGIQCFGAPRRLAVRVADLTSQQLDRQTERRGPSVAQALDGSGQPSKAALGFARSCGVDFDALERLSTDKGEWLVYRALSVGRMTVDLLPDIVTRAIEAMPIAKPMRWGGGGIEFVRPVHWVVMLYGERVIDCEVLGLGAGRTSLGHRFHHPGAVSIDKPADYEEVLRRAKVIVDFDERQTIICKQLDELATKQAANAVLPQSLLDEVTALVEWPEALLAKFDASYLNVPPEALIAAMQGHQKSFALKDAEGQLLPYFITVSNLDSLNPAQVIAGNEKVMAARLSDAAFFYQQDNARGLASHLSATKNVVFQVSLGSLFDKTLRVSANALTMAKSLGADEQTIKRTVELSKCDLMTDMVGEFPELQGVMGYHYALHDGEGEAVAIALKEQYKPRFSSDDLPASVNGAIVSMAERLDTLVGIFSIKQKPSGVKDPFKCRRHARALVRLLSESTYALNLSELLQHAISLYPIQDKDALLLKELKSFILDRLIAWYQDSVGLDVIHAVLARQNENLFDVKLRLEAVQAFKQLDESRALAEANKRVAKLLSSQDDDRLNEDFDVGLFVSSQEAALADAILSLETGIPNLMAAKHYTATLEQLAGLHQAIEAFFDKVMVMVEDLSLRHNRLALLKRLRNLFLNVADISLLS